MIDKPSAPTTIHLSRSSKEPLGRFVEIMTGRKDVAANVAILAVIARAEYRAERLVSAPPPPSHVAALVN